MVWTGKGTAATRRWNYARKCYRGVTHWPVKTAEDFE
jgi:hypothetical protein